MRTVKTDQTGQMLGAQSLYWFCHVAADTENACHLYIDVIIKETFSFLLLQ